MQILTIRYPLPQAWVRLPNDPGLAGVWLFLQGIAVDSGTGTIVPTTEAWQAGLIPSPLPPQPYQSLYRSRYSTDPSTGLMHATSYFAPVMRFQ